MDVFEKLRQAPELTESDRAIVSYVLDHPDEVARLSTRELGHLTHTSASSVVRLSRRLGFASWGEFKVGVASDLRRARPGDTSMGEHERALSASAKVAELERSVISETLGTLDLTALQRAADLLVGVDEVDVCARDTNVILASYAAHLLSMSGRLASVRESIDPIIRYANTTPTDHAAILVSRGGNDTTLLEAARILRSRGVGTVLVTTAPASPLADTCDHVLCGFYGDLATFGEVIWHTSARYILDVLFTMVFSDRREGNRRQVQDHYDSLAASLYGDDAWDQDAMRRL